MNNLERSNSICQKILTGDYNGAMTEFYDPHYKLIEDKYYTMLRDEFISDKNKPLYVAGFDPLTDDGLCRVVSSIRNSKVPLYRQQQVLQTILYSDKLLMFNTGLFADVEMILGIQETRRFKHHLVLRDQEKGFITYQTEMVDSELIVSYAEPTDYMNRVYSKRY